ncbi:MAG: hypothetical protein RL033_7772 [Pseudomonadota bacterium]
MSGRSLALAGISLVLLPACSGERWVIGEALDAGTDAAVQADAATGPSCPAVTAPEGISLPGAPPALAGAHLGNWVATLLGAEADAFPSGRLRLRLTGDGAALLFESRNPVPALIDATGGYLCSTSVESCASEAEFVAGFDYTMVEASSRGSILSFGVFLDEPWNEWCRQQAPVEDRQPGCDPRYGVERAYEEARWGASCAVRRGAEWSDIACDRLATVERQVCACTADGCLARARLQQVHLRLVSPRILEGALWFTADRAQALVFAREE